MPRRITLHQATIDEGAILRHPLGVGDDARQCLYVVRVYRRDGERFARPVELAREAGDELTTPLLPSLVLPLDRIFRE